MISFDEYSDFGTKMLIEMESLVTLKHGATLKDKIAKDEPIAERDMRI